MSIAFLLKGVIKKPQNIIYRTTPGQRKNFLLAPVIAYNLDTRPSACAKKVVVLPQKNNMVLMPELQKKSIHATNLQMSKNWLKLQQIRSLHTNKSGGGSHIPTSKQELLAQARGFFERLKIRIKYPLMRQIRPWTLNDATALFSWLFLGHTVWLLVGTTSFVSLILWFANSLQTQGKKKKKKKKKKRP
jgi:hypothetical protein